MQHLILALWEGVTTRLRDQSFIMGATKQKGGGGASQVCTPTQLGGGGGLVRKVLAPLKGEGAQQVLR